MRSPIVAALCVLPFLLETHFTTTVPFSSQTARSLIVAAPCILSFLSKTHFTTTVPRSSQPVRSLVVADLCVVPFLLTLPVAVGNSIYHSGKEWNQHCLAHFGTHACGCA